LIAVGSRLPGLDPVGILAGGVRVVLAGVVALGVAQAAAAAAPGGAVGILILAGTCGAVAYAVALMLAQAAAAAAPGGAVGILILAGTCGAVAYAVALMLVSRDDARLALDFVAPWLGRPRPASA
ncbi:MAG: hypothetical protein DME08_21105, partial [Candidatus Rokuibacteriota bacterium]